MQECHKLGQLVEEHWFMLGKVASQQNIELVRQIGQLAHFAAYADAEIWEKVEAMQNTAEVDADEPPPSLKATEWKVLSNPALAPSARDFKVTAVLPPLGYEYVLKQVVLVERLREVRALVGFTRIESPGDFAEVVEFPEEMYLGSAVCRAYQLAGSFVARGGLSCLSLFAGDLVRTRQQVSG